MHSQPETVVRSYLLDYINIFILVQLSVQL